MARQAAPKRGDGFQCGCRLVWRSHRQDRHLTESSDFPVSRDRWRAAPARDLQWAGWDGDYAVFHAPSGQTHFVNGATARLLREVLVTPKTIELAAFELAAAEGAEPGPDFLPGVAELVERLEALGLVERVQA